MSAAAAAGEPVTVDVSDAVATVTLNRPEAMNSLDTPTKVALRDTLHEVAADDDVRCVVVTGTGRAFCVGQDLREHARYLAERPPDEVWSTVADHYIPIARTLATMPKPVVAAVNGVAAGAGASMAFACDIRILADTATFNLAFSAIGLSCDTGASWTLPRLVGRAKATELLFLPRSVPADEAFSLGLATSVVPPEQLRQEAAAVARRLAAGPTVAYAALRRSLAYAAAHSFEDTLAFEGQMMALTGGTQDHRDAVTAFVAKQRPTFSGR